MTLFIILELRIVEKLGVGEIRLGWQEKHLRTPQNPISQSNVQRMYEEAK